MNCVFVIYSREVVQKTMCMTYRTVLYEIIMARRISVLWIVSASDCVKSSSSLWRTFFFFANFLCTWNILVFLLMQKVICQNISSRSIVGLPYPCIPLKTWLILSQRFDGIMTQLHLIDSWSLDLLIIDIDWFHDRMNDFSALITLHQWNRRIKFTK